MLLVNILKTSMFFVNVLFKLLSPEAFLAENVLNIIWGGRSGQRRGNMHHWPKGNGRH